MERNREDRNLPAEVRRSLAGIAAEVLGVAIEVAASVVAAAVGLTAIVARVWQAAGSAPALPRRAVSLPAPGHEKPARPATIEIPPTAIRRPPVDGPRQVPAAMPERPAEAAKPSAVTPTPPIETPFEPPAPPPDSAGAATPAPRAATPAAPVDAAKMGRVDRADPVTAEAAAARTPKPRGLAPDARGTEPTVRYRGSRVVAVARDPETVFAWWEVDPETRVRAARDLGVHGDSTSDTGTATELLSIATAAADGSVERQEMPVPAGASSRWVPVARGARRIEITLEIAAGAHRLPLAGPAVVRLPSSGISPDTSVRWRRAGAPPGSTVGLPVPSATEVERVWQDLLRLEGDSEPRSSGDLQPPRSALHGLLEGATNPVGSS